MGFVGPGEAEEVLDTLGLSGGNERMSRYTSFSLSAAYLPHLHPSKRKVALAVQVGLYINEQT